MDIKFTSLVFVIFAMLIVKMTFEHDQVERKVTDIETLN